MGASVIEACRTLRLFGACRWAVALPASVYSCSAFVKCNIRMQMRHIEAQGKLYPAAVIYFLRTLR